jgi:hypothetical protein
LAKLLAPHIRTIRLEGDIDVFVRERLHLALAPLEGVDLAIIDVAKVAHFDLTLVNGLLHLKNCMSARNQASSVRLIGTTPFLRRVLGITKLSAAFGLPVEWPAATPESDETFIHAPAKKRPLHRMIWS